MFISKEEVMRLTLASLFDGSGTAPLAAAACGITPVWASEIEPYPIRVTTKRFPNMKHYGSITDINGATAEPVDIISGGSPCQDLSVAGKQAGLDGGTRSHLFYEMVRIIKEMRKATNGRKPKYIIWENVPGAFSSNNGRDFLSVLQSFAEIAESDVHVPEPERKADKLIWRNAGEMVGNGWSIAWRTVDAQFWGVPQRRRRIYLVVDLDSECAGEILFERNSVSGNTEPSREARKETADDAHGSVNGENNVKCLNPWDSQTIRQYSIDGVAPNLNANTGGGQNRWGVCYPNVARTLTAEHDASPCIGGDYGGGSEMLCVYDARGNGSGEIAPTLTGDHENRVTDYTAVSVYPNITGALMANSHPGSYSGQDAYNDMFPVFKENTNYIVRRLMPIECSRMQGFPDWWELGLETENPTEEEIAFWTDVFETHRKIVNPDVKPKTRNQIIKWLKNPYSDSASYKMWGNGMAYPNMLFVIKRICRYKGGGVYF